MSRIPLLEETVEEKKVAFRGYDDQPYPILESSFKASFSLLPKPLNKVAEVIYEKYDGRVEDKMDAVISYLDILRRKDEIHYNKVKKSLDEILNSLEGTGYDPIIPDKNDDIVLLIKDLLITDEQSEQLLRELGKFIPPQQ